MILWGAVNTMLSRDHFVGTVVMLSSTMQWKRVFAVVAAVHATMSTTPI